MKKFFSTVLAAMLGVILIFSAACVDGTGGGNGVRYTVNVVSIGGQPIEGVTVTASLDGSVQSTDISDENGQIVFNLPAAEYGLQVDENTLPAGYTPARRTVYTEAREMEVEVVLNSAIIDEKAPDDLIYQEGDVIYNFTYTEVDSGEERTLLDAFEVDGKNMVLINLFYTTCTPCINETPAMVEAYTEEHQQNVSIISISSYARDTAALVSSFKSRYEMTWDVCYDETGGDIITNNIDYSDSATQGFPTNIIVDRYGVICLIEYGGITDSRIFSQWFEMYGGDDYDQNIGSDFEPVVPDIENPLASDIKEAVVSSDGSTSANGRSFEFRWEEGDSATYTWPWLVNEEGGIMSSNAGVLGSYAIVYVDFTIEQDAILAFEYMTDINEGDAFYIFMDGEILLTFTGDSGGYQTCYAFAGDGEEHELAFAYVKDTIIDTTTDTVYVRNLRVTDNEELVEREESLSVLRSAATGLVEDTDGTSHFTNYIDIRYNSNDGFYHKLNEDGSFGPIVYAEMRDDTNWNYALFDILYQAEQSGATADNNILMEYQYLIRTYSVYEVTMNTQYGIDMAPLTQPLYDALYDIVGELGDDSVADEDELLELCFYYESYGVTADNVFEGNPLEGITAEFPITVANAGDTMTMDTLPKSPRGAYFTFTPAVDGVYDIIASNPQSDLADSTTLGIDMWYYGSDYDTSDYYYILNPPTIMDGDNGLQYDAEKGYYFTLELEAGVTYYFAAALDDINIVGTFDLEILPSDETHVVRSAAANFYEIEMDENGNVPEDAEIYLPKYINPVLGADGYYHAYSLDGTTDYGLLYVSFKQGTNYGETPLEYFIHEFTIENEDGTTTTVGRDNGFDFTESGYFKGYYDRLEAEYEADLAEWLADNPNATREDYENLNGVFVNRYERLSAAQRVDYSDVMLNKYLAQANKNDYGFVAATPELVEILQILTELEGAFTTDTWLQLCYYIQYFD